ncbi:NAD(P)/FAD-dependent oxidoreductase [Pleomorphovibrio marinus]|uniref:NAD(P)/FAD-dependent oxidoreductase n=1 Tax=Pleomorphovibrio marinus TaxID=2164132 RepID=UPI000E0C622A|nr:FAD-dependent oxidoreductase [Pleomorphovibrio marinus]
MKVDFLLIGQGLAGTVLSYRLISQGKSVLLIDTPRENSSSRVAAGLYNPITGRKMVKTWQADILFKEIEPFYSHLEKLLTSRFLYPTPIYRPFLSIEDQNEWMGKSADPQYRDYLGEIHTQSKIEEVNDPYGGILLNHSGYLDIGSLLDKYGIWLLEAGRLRQELYEEDKLTLFEGGLTYKDVEAKAIVYANGNQAKNSRFFSFLPFSPVRGEILTIRQGLDSNCIINRGVFRIELPDGTKKLGATYDRIDLEAGETEKGKKELLEKLANLINLPVDKILKHQVGIRPATRDRKPFLGKHPHHNQVYIFNGLGAKGVSLAPYFSKEMSDLLLKNRELQKEVNINRFFKYI